MPWSIQFPVLATAALICAAGCQSTSRTESLEDRSPGLRVAKPAQAWPDDIMEGTWEGEAWRINSRGASHILDRLEITSESNGLLKVKRTWKTLEGAGGHKGRTPVMSDEEDLVGVFDPSSGHFRLVEMDEPGTIDGWLVDQNTIDFFSTQPGRQPSTSHEQLTRKTSP